MDLTKGGDEMKVSDLIVILKKKDQNLPVYNQIWNDPTYLLETEINETVLEDEEGEELKVLLIGEA
jgi:hypothetical protein